jgi:hypothetical protein
MNYSRLKWMAFSLGALTLCLSAQAETPGLQRVGCCGADDWEAARAVPPAAGGEASQSLIRRSRSRHDWSVRVAGLESPRFGLPAPIDRGLQRFLGDAPTTRAAARGDEDVGRDEEFTQWSFVFLPVWSSYGPAEFGRRKCKERAAWCRRHGPPHGPLPAVPEPSTWVLLVISVAGVGVALRRRRAQLGAPLDPEAG